MNKHGYVKNLLEQGRHTSVELCRLANTSDARKIISILRADFRNGVGGADVQDEWLRSSTGTRYKVYWISQHLTTKGGRK